MIKTCGLFKKFQLFLLNRPIKMKYLQSLQYDLYDATYDYDDYDAIYMMLYF